MWQNTVLASAGYVLGLVIYTGKETRSKMNAREPNTKFGKLDLELNRLSKLLFIFMIALAFCMVAMNEF